MEMSIKLYAHLADAYCRVVPEVGSMEGENKVPFGMDSGASDSLTNYCCVHCSCTVHQNRFYLSILFLSLT